MNMMGAPAPNPAASTSYETAAPHESYDNEYPHHEAVHIAAGKQRVPKNAERRQRRRQQQSEQDLDADFGDYNADPQLLGRTFTPQDGADPPIHHGQLGRGGGRGPGGGHDHGDRVNGAEAMDYFQGSAGAYDENHMMGNPQPFFDTETYAAYNPPSDAPAPSPPGGAFWSWEHETQSWVRGGRQQRPEDVDEDSGWDKYESVVSPRDGDAAPPAERSFSSFREKDHLDLTSSDSRAANMASSGESFGGTHGGASAGNGNIRMPRAQTAIDNGGRVILYRDSAQSNGGEWPASSERSQQAGQTSPVVSVAPIQAHDKMPETEQQPVNAHVSAPIAPFEPTPEQHARHLTTLQAKQGDLQAQSEVPKTLESRKYGRESQHNKWTRASGRFRQRSTTPPPTASPFQESLDEETAVAVAGVDREVAAAKAVSATSAAINTDIVTPQPTDSQQKDPGVSRSETIVIEAQPGHLDGAKKSGRENEGTGASSRQGGDEKPMNSEQDSVWAHPVTDTPRPLARRSGLREKHSSPLPGAPSPAVTEDPAVLAATPTLTQEGSAVSVTAAGAAAAAPPLEEPASTDPSRSDFGASKVNNVTARGAGTQVAKRSAAAATAGAVDGGGNLGRSVSWHDHALVLTGAATALLPRGALASAAKLCGARWISRFELQDSRSLPADMNPVMAKALADRLPSCVSTDENEMGLGRTRDGCSRNLEAYHGLWLIVM